MAKRKTLKDRVLDWLYEHKSINQLEATKYIGTTRLGALIYLLRHEDGYKIKDEWVISRNRYGDTIKYKNYYLDE